jgi:glycosyltransferase involved in cell wall biosynthesis
MTRSRHGTALVVHADLATGGGAELYGARVLALLQRRFAHVALVHAGPPVDAADLARLHGVRLDGDRLTVISAGPGRVLATVTSRFHLLKYALALRAARPLAGHCDLLVSTYGECPVDAPRVLQCIHVPLFLDDRRSLLHLGVTRLSPVGHLARRAYVRLARAVAGWDPEVVRRQATVANSWWTARVMNASYRMAHADCLYPGARVEIAPGDPGDIPFARREDGFVVVGRLVPAKRIETAVAIVEALRRRGRHVHLHVIGRAAGRYRHALRRHLKGKPWMHLHEGLPRAEMEALVARHRYGLHAYRHEHFGSAPAELQRLGCLVFVHNSGGQREVIAAPEQRYRSIGDAVARIERVMDDPALQVRLLARAREANRLLTVAAFEDAFLAAVDGLMADTEPTTAWATRPLTTLRPAAP